MSVRFKVRVINNPKGLPIYPAPSETTTSIGKKNNGDEFISDKSNTSITGATWFRVEGGNSWVLYQYKGATNLKILRDVSAEEPPSSSMPVEPEITTEPAIIAPTIVQPSIETQQQTDAATQTVTMKPEQKVIKPVADIINAAESIASHVEDGLYAALEEGIRQGYTMPKLKRSIDVVQQNANNYPPVYTRNNNEEIIYDFSTDYSSINEMLNVIKKEMNIPTAYNRDQINKLMNGAFNRFHVTYPDFQPTGLSAVAFFTRPDLWLLDDDGAFLDQVQYEPQLYYISRVTPSSLKQLTYDYSASHDFIPLLCNTCRSLDIGDETVETMDIGETFSGNKIQYAKHNIRSMVAGTFNCKFEESYNMEVTHLLQGWCSYESAVYLGSLLPRTEYIGRGIIDYASCAYVFLVDRMNIIRFFSKYYGVFPISVSKSIFSYDEGQPVHFPEQNATFAYFRRKDLDPSIFIEFNAHSTRDFMYKSEFNSAFGIGGQTWVGPPFVEYQHINNGTPEGADQFILRHRPNTLRV